MMPSTDARSARVDAVRNRQSLLAAAEAEFSERGVAVSIADIARRAGVAKGTVFRHFATKDDLIAAIVTGHLTTLVDSARSGTRSNDPGAALLEFLTVAADERRQHDIDFLWTVTENNPEVIELRDRLFTTIEVLSDRARKAGAIRTDVTAADIYLLMCAPVHVVDNLPNPSPTLWKRYLAIIFDGLRPEGAHALPEGPPKSIA